MPAGLVYLLPEALLAVVAIVALFSEGFPARGATAAGIGAASALAAAGACVWIGAPGVIADGALTLDPTAAFTRSAVALLTAIFLLWLTGRGMPGERRQEAVALDGGPDLLGARRDEQLRPRLEPLGGRLAGDRRGAGDVLVGRVGARAHQSHFQFLGIAVAAHGLGELGQRPGRVGRERAVDVGLQC